MRMSAFKSSLWLCLLIAIECIGQEQHSQHIDSLQLQTILQSDSLLLPTCEEGGEIIRHFAYILCFDDRYRNSKWVAYRLTRTHLNHPMIERTGKFREDPNVMECASPEDYKKSGFDRGHLCPAADNKWSEQAMRECFYMDNMSPQAPSFNRGVWNKLEDQVRKWAEQDSEIFVVTGGVLKDGLPKIGQHRVSVPHSFYKVIFDCSEKDLKMIGFILPNAKSDKELYQFAVPVDSIEHLTGIDFFPLFPDSFEELLEKKCDISQWFLKNNRNK